MAGSNDELRQKTKNRAFQCAHRLGSYIFAGKPLGEQFVRHILLEHGMSPDTVVPRSFSFLLTRIRYSRKNLRTILKEHKITKTSLAAALFAERDAIVSDPRCIASILKTNGENGLHTSVASVIEMLWGDMGALMKAVQELLPGCNPIFEKARTLQSGVKFHSTQEDHAVAKTRHVETPGVVQTSVVCRIKEIMDDEDADGSKTMVIGGASGSGKTSGVIGVSSETDNRIVIYARAKEDELNDATLVPEKENGNSISDNAKEARNRKVLDYLSDAVTRAVTDTQVRNAMQSTAERLKVLVAVDELGAHDQAVRAMCALTGAELKAAVTEKWGMELPKVVFFLAAVGTGIGWAPGYNRNVFVTSVGSEQSNFEYISTEGNHRTASGNALSNWEIFASYFQIAKQREFIDGFRVRCHPIADRLISGNARFASCVAKAVLGSFAKGFASRESRQKLLSAIDISMFIGPAAMHFKSLNGLSELTLETSWASLVKAVRLHLYPFDADGEDARTFEVKQGLVQNLTLVDGRRSPIHMSTFAVVLLSTLVGLPIITQSAVDGGPFEEYVLGMLYLVACGAGGSGAFTRALTHNGGKMGPLLAKEVSAGAGKVNATGERENTPHLRLHSFLHDMARDEIPEKPTLDDIVKAFTEKLKEAGFEQGGAEDVFVVAFRCYDKAPFADVFIIVGNVLYLFQCKDTADSTSIAIDLERWKMGSMDDAAQFTAGDSAPADAPRNLIKKIIKAHFARTGIAITDVRSFIARPRETTKYVDTLKTLKNETFEVSADLKTKKNSDNANAKRSWTVTYHKLAIIDTSGIEFMSFLPDRKRVVQPYLFKSAPTIEIEKVTTPVPVEAVSAIETPHCPSGSLPTTRLAGKKTDRAVTVHHPERGGLGKKTKRPQYDTVRMVDRSSSLPTTRLAGKKTDRAVTVHCLERGGLGKKTKRPRYDTVRTMDRSNDVHVTGNTGISLAVAWKKKGQRLL